MEKINVAELLKECPQGMELDCAIWDDVVFESIEPGNYPIRIRIKDAVAELTEFGEWNYTENSKCVIFPKGKTTWEGFIPLYKFKEGDVIVKRNFIAIIHLIEEEGKVWYHCWFNTKYENYKLKKDYGIGNINDGDEVRLATEEEKQKLFDAIKDKGYKWNEETKSLEKLAEPKFKVGDYIRKKQKNTVRLVSAVCDNHYLLDEKDITLPFFAQDNWELVPNKFDINTLVPFESRVLVRDNKTDAWKPAYWGFYDETNITIFPYETVGGNCFSMCIPYEENEHLIGKTDDCNDFYKNWK